MIETTNYIEQLLCVLDKDIEHIEQTLLRLDELRSLLIKRDEKALNHLLEKIQTESDEYAANEYRRQNLRKKLAKQYNCPAEQMRLSMLENLLEGPLKEQIAGKKDRIESLSRKLVAEHRATTMLLNECARFNGQMLSGILNMCRKNSATYNSTGKNDRPQQAAFMNVRF